MRKDSVPQNRIKLGGVFNCISPPGNGPIKITIKVPIMLGLYAGLDKLELTHTIEPGVIHARKGVFDPEGILAPLELVEHCPD